MPDYYSAASDPANDSDLDSSIIRAEWTALAAGFAKIAGYTGNGGKVLAINAGGTAMEALTTTGTGSGVRATSPTLVTPVLGIATATSINKLTLTQPATGATLTLTDGKTLAATHTLTLSGTDGTVMTFPTTTATIARTDAANTFTGVQAMTSPSITTSIVTPSTSFDVFNTVATTVNAFGAASTALNIGNASAAAAFPGGISIAASKSITGTVANSTISGFLSVAATTGTFTNVGGTLSTAAQPNITSVGALTDLLVGTGGGGRPTYVGKVVIDNAGGNGPAVLGGLEFITSSTGSGYGVKLYTNNASDYFGIATRQASATWTERFKISQTDGAVTIPGTLGVTGTLTAGAISGTTGIYSDTTDASSSTTGSLKTAGGLGVAKTIVSGEHLWVKSGTAVPAGGGDGTTGIVISSGGIWVLVGSGAPNLSSAKGSLYLRSDGSTTNDRLYINTSGANNWTAITTGS